MRTLTDTETVQQFVAAVAIAELLPLAAEPQNGRMYNHGGVFPGSADPAVLELPNGVHWLAPFGTTSSLMFVRPAYKILLLLAMAFVDYPEAPHHRVVVTGSSGTGKTTFLSWMLYHLRRLDKPPVIVLDINGFFGRIAFDGEVVAGIRGSHFQQELADRSTVYLCDASWSADCFSHGPKIQARTIVTAPPSTIFTETRPSDTMRTRVLVMPPWTMAELETCRSTCYSEPVSQETLLELFQLWGGAVRWTIGTSSQESKQEFMSSLRALSFPSVVEIVRSGGLASNEDDSIGSRLIHMHVDSDSTFQVSGAALCSSIACSLLVGADSKQLQLAHNYVNSTSFNAEPKPAQLFFQQVQQELFERSSIL